jgi:hypothetical protein
MSLADAVDFRPEALLPSKAPQKQNVVGDVEMQKVEQEEEEVGSQEDANEDDLFGDNEGG